ncbi:MULTISPECIES: hypothetical protein [Streptomyces]|uniref:DNA-binding protein n=2 Tax=Streptomyces TaxID=1883 RepID=A0A2U9NVW9_STRAS|nr:hypothetical protein [Streptomyces actuosus]AWT41254.1 hypothetical protein DMT42_02295 [Streptomyces actuosus]MBM4826207.1 hypothetical protein [Streptomyces actuosus]
MSHDLHDQARQRLSRLAADPADEESPAGRLRRDAALVGRLLEAAAREDEIAAVPDQGAAHADTEADVAAGLSLLEEMRVALDQLEAQVVMEARRRGLDWRQIARHRGLNSSQAASQRYQRLVTRLEEMRQGVR